MERYAIKITHLGKLIGYKKIYCSTLIQVWEQMGFILHSRVFRRHFKNHHSLHINELVALPPVALLIDLSTEHFENLCILYNITILEMEYVKLMIRGIDRKCMMDGIRAANHTVVSQQVVDCHRASIHTKTGRLTDEEVAKIFLL